MFSSWHWYMYQSVRMLPSRLRQFLNRYAYKDLNKRTMGKNKKSVEATINADIQKVWNYWTSPDHIVNWNFASDDWHCPSAENDIRTGGKFSSTMASRDGKMSFDFGGVCAAGVSVFAHAASNDPARGGA